jgi:hypothetical protein
LDERACEALQCRASDEKILGFGVAKAKTKSKNEMAYAQAMSTQGVPEQKEVQDRQAQELPEQIARNDQAEQPLQPAERAEEAAQPGAQPNTQSDTGANAQTLEFNTTGSKLRNINDKLLDGFSYGAAPGLGLMSLVFLQGFESSDEKDRAHNRSNSNSTFGPTLNPITDVFMAVAGSVIATVGAVGGGAVGAMVGALQSVQGDTYTEKILKTGMMKKLGKKPTITSWKQRYFVLTTHTLVYFSDPGNLPLARSFVGSLVRSLMRSRRIQELPWRFAFGINLKH